MARGNILANFDNKYPELHGAPPDITITLCLKKRPLISRLKIKTLSTHWVFVIWGKGHHFPAIDKWRGFLPTNATKRLFWRDIYYVDYVYICYRVWIRFMTRQNGDKLFRQRRLRAEFVSRLRLEEEKWGKEKRVPRARQHLLTQLIIRQSSVFSRKCGTKKRGQSAKVTSPEDHFQ